MMNLDDPTCHGWDGNYEAVWDENSFPEDLSELLIEEEKYDNDDAELEFVSDDSDYDFDSDVGSDSEIDGNLHLFQSHFQYHYHITIIIVMLSWKSFVTLSLHKICQNMGFL